MTTLLEIFKIAGIDPSKGKAKLVIESQNDDVKDAVSEFIGRVFAQYEETDRQPKYEKVGLSLQQLIPSLTPDQRDHIMRYMYGVFDGEAETPIPDDMDIFQFVDRMFAHFG